MKCFIITPFDPCFRRVYEVIREAVASSLGDTPVECDWLKDANAAGRITDDITMGIVEASFCVADVSGHNPNVMWETGYAMALGKPMILIGRNVEELPFDLKDHRVLKYSPERFEELRNELIKAIRDTFWRFCLNGTVVQEKLKAMKDEFELIKLGEVPLTELELAHAAEQCLLDNVSECRYYAIHIVDCRENLLTWGAENINYEQMTSYVHQQREVLNSGGAVTRLFLFKRSLLEDHLDMCTSILEYHDQFFSGTQNRVETLCGLIPSRLTFGLNDFSIINNTAAFLWTRSTKPEIALVARMPVSS